MTGELTKYDFNGCTLRVVMIEGEPWFVAKDAAEALNYANPQQAVRLHCKYAQPVGGAKNEHPSDLDPQTVIIPESDLYRMILRSDKPEAEEFQAFVTEEVLPAIRRTGSYGADPMEKLNDPAFLRQTLADYADKVLELQPKADAYDLIGSADGTFCVTDAAKVLNQRPKDLFAWLSANKWIYRRAGIAHWVGYQDKIQRGYLDHRVEEVTRGDGSVKITEQVRITGKGMTKLADAFKVAEAA